jgi:Protein of unknown function (DUF4242)
MVERYLPTTELTVLSALVRRVADVCTSPRPAEPSVRYVHSLYIPAEDTCFCVFEAASAQAVREANEAGGFPIDRISAGFGFDTTADRQAALAAPLTRQPRRRTR